MIPMHGGCRNLLFLYLQEIIRNHVMQEFVSECLRLVHPSRRLLRRQLGDSASATTWTYVGTDSRTDASSAATSSDMARPSRACSTPRPAAKGSLAATREGNYYRNTTIEILL